MTVRTLEELYGFSREFVGELEQSGHHKLADEMERALTGGTTSGEIFMYLALAFQDVEKAGLGDDRTAEALAYLREVAETSRRKRR